MYYIEKNVRKYISKWQCYTRCLRFCSHCNDYMVIKTKGLQIFHQTTYASKKVYISAIRSHYFCLQNTLGTQTPTQEASQDIALCWSVTYKMHWRYTEKHYRD